MTRAGKERRRNQLNNSAEATSDSVDAGNSSLTVPLGKRKGSFGDDTSSSEKKVGKRRQSNHENTATLATYSKDSKKGNAKADSQQHKTANTLINTMDVDNTPGTNKAIEETHGDQNAEMAGRDSLKAPLTGVTHSDDKMAAMIGGDNNDQHQVKPERIGSSGTNDGDSNDNDNHEDDIDDDPQASNDHDAMLLDSGIGGNDYIEFAYGFHDDYDEYDGEYDDGDDYDRYDQDGEFGMHDPFGHIRNGTSGQQFRAILENLKSNDDQAQQRKTLQNLAETLSISSEENLAGYFPCDGFAQELVKIMKGSTGPDENEDGMQHDFTVNDQDGGGNPELMILACRCVSNLLDVFPSAAPHMVNHGVVGALCDKLRSIQYIDLAEQALEALNQIASQTPMAVIQNGGLGATFVYFDFFNIHAQRTALQMASYCMRFINTGSYRQLVEVLPTLTNTLSNSDRTVVELTCLCWARLSENYRSTPAEFEKVVSMDILTVMVGLLPVPGNSNAIRSNAFNDILRVFRSVAKASPTLGHQLLHLDIIRSFYQVLTGVTDTPSSSTSLISLDNTWHDSLHTILNIIVDLLPPIPKDQEFDWNRFKKMEPIALRTRSRTTHQQDTPIISSSSSSTSAMASSSSSATVKTPSVPDPRTELLENNPQVLQRVGAILFPLLLEIFSSTVNLAIRQLVTHTLVKLVFFMDGDTLKCSLQDIPLSAFLADLLAHQEHSVFVIDALFQAEFLLKKLPGVYSTLLQREGVYHATKALVNQPLLGKDGTLDSGKKSSEETKGEKVLDCVSTTMHTNTKSERSDTMQRPTTYSICDHSSITNLTIPTTNATEELSHQHSMRSDINPFMDILLQQRLLMYKTLQNHQLPADESKSGVGQGSIQQFIIQLAQNHIKDYTTASLTAKNRGMDSLQVLKQFADNLIGSPEDTTACKVLEKLVVYINSTTLGISGFELLESGILESLLDYLTIDQQKQDNRYAAPLVQRRQAFYTVFLKTMVLDQDTGLLVSPALRILIQRLETLLTRFERFEVELPLGSAMLSSSSSSGLVQNLVELVSKQLRLRLNGRGPHITAASRQLTVATQAVSTFHTLEKYLLDCGIGTGAISSNLNANNTPNNGNKSAPSSSTVAMDLDKTELKAKDSSHQTASQNHTTETASTSISTVTKSPVGSSTSASSQSSSTPIASTTTEQSQNTSNGKYKVRFYINNTLIPNDTSLYGAVHRSEMKKRKENGSRAANYNIWSTTHDVIFEFVPIGGGENDTEKKEKAPVRSPPKQLTDDKNNPCLKILQLLHELATVSQPSAIPSHSGHLDNVATTALVPRTDFVNRKLTTKIQRQLEEPLIVASACLPDWAYYCMDNYSFLFPFDVRYLYLQSTSFGVRRLLANWQNLHRRTNSNTQDGTGQRHLQQQGIDSGRYEPMIGITGELLQQSQTASVRIERKKVQVRREQILDCATKVMALPGNLQSALEIGYMDEEGTGLGPTLEFYALASNEFCKLSTRMWRQEEENDSNPSSGGDDEQNNNKLYATSQHGLFPAPFYKQLHQKHRRPIIRLFKTLGQFVAKSMLDSRMIDIPFNVAFFKRLLYDDDDPLALIMDIDPVLGRSISHLQAYVDKKQSIENDTALTPKKRDKLIGKIEIDGAKIDDLYLDFTLPGRADIDLKHNGSKTPVTIKSVEEYIQLLGDVIVVSGVNEQVSAFRDGFNELFSVKRLKVLTCQELVSLFSSSTEDWSYSTLADTIKADHGFTMDSATIKNLLEILSEMTLQEQRDFLQFTTGSPRLPIGGWKSMRPMFTVVKKHCEAPLGPDDYLPSVMTCANYLKMPDYTNKKIMHKQLLKSMHEGKNSFLLS